MFQIVPTELNPPRHPRPHVFMRGENTCVALGRGVGEQEPQIQLAFFPPFQTLKNYKRTKTTLRKIWKPEARKIVQNLIP